jgi:hypothetical protein
MNNPIGSSTRSYHVKYCARSTIILLSLIVVYFMMGLFLLKYKINNSISTQISQYIGQFMKQESITPKELNTTERFLNFKIFFDSVNEVILFPKDGLKIKNLAPHMHKYNLCCLTDTSRLCTNNIHKDDQSGILCIVLDGQIQIQIYGPIFTDVKSIMCDFSWWIK